jgi:hypothetical protein
VSLQEAALQASLAAASAMQGPASPSKASLATSKSTDPEDHSKQGGSPASSAPGLRRRSGSMSAARRTASVRRGSRPAQRNSSRLTDLSAAASSGLHAALLPLHRGATSSEDSDELGPLHRFGSMGTSGLGYGGSGSGLLHAQSSTINLSAGQLASSGDDFYDIEDDAASYFSATSNLLSSGGGGQGELPPFSHLPNSAETSTLDLLLVTRRGDGISSADGTSAAAASGQAPSTAGDLAAGNTPQTTSAAQQQGGSHAQHLAVTVEGGYALPGTGLQLRRSRLACAGMLLRAYTEGWWIAVACVQQYYAVVQGAIAKQQQEAAVADTADGKAAVDIAGPSLELDSSSWLLEVVATGGTGACRATLYNRVLAMTCHAEHDAQATALNHHQTTASVHATPGRSHFGGAGADPGAGSSCCAEERAACQRACAGGGAACRLGGARLRHHSLCNKCSAAGCPGWLGWPVRGACRYCTDDSTSADQCSVTVAPL